jgi:glyoxylase-like metal-dependent hydrolase (beta-lactamase superfamily II)
VEIAKNVYQCHIENEKNAQVMHPGGSNVYFIGDPKQEMILLDTGEHSRRWTKTITNYYEHLGKPKMTSIVITHGHGDHTGGIERLQEIMQCPVRCHPKLVKGLQTFVDDEDMIVKLQSREILRTGGDVSLRAVFTPGHSDDHVCYYLSREKILFTGDIILGNSPSTVSDLADYMKSLEQLGKLRVDTICPAHGQVVSQPAGQKLKRAGNMRIQWYIDHRQLRENQILGALEKGIIDIEKIVREIYPKNLKKKLRKPAAGNVKTHLDKLSKEKRIQEKPAEYTINNK